MERIAKLFLILIIAVCSFCPVYAENAVIKQQAPISLNDCVKTFPVGYEKLFYLTLAAVNEFDYKITEIQTRGGYIAFVIKNNKKFLASIVYVSSAKAMLKITPYNGVYDFSTAIPMDIFKYIETYQTKNF